MARKTKQQVRDEQIEALELRAIEARVRLAESAASYYDSIVDPSDAFRDDDTGELWQGIGTDSNDKSAQVTTEAQLATLRAESRTLAATNPFAANAIENRISYVVGTGHAYSVQANRGRAVDPEQLAAAQQILDDFLDLNRWHARQQEIVRRKDRDGECFLRVFVDPAGDVKLRFVEPGQVAAPPNPTPAQSWGIETEPDDVETPLAYCIDGQWLPAKDVQHRKANVDLNVKRGLPLLYPVRKNLTRAAKLLRNMSVVAEIQTAIAMLRKHKGGSAGGIQSWAQGAADASVHNATTGKTSYHRHYPPGTILDTIDIDYEFPAQGLDGSRYVTILQAELRAIASRLCMPEFMLSSDASNANYASTMVAEGPAVKIFERLQWQMIEDDLAIIDMALNAAVAAGKLEQQLREDVEVQATPPTVASRDRTKEVAADVQLANAGAMSIHTLQLKNDLDPDTEDEHLEQERTNRDPLAGLFDAGGGGDDDDDEDDDEGEDDAEPPTTEGDDGSWVTINGAAVHIGKGGAIDKGPKGMVGKKPGDVRGGGKDKTDKTRSAKAEAARKSYKPATKEKQDLGEGNERRIAKKVGGQQLDDNEPADVIVPGAGGKPKIAIEVKTLVDAANDKITVHPESRRRKEEWSRKNKAPFHTVVMDNRGKGAPKIYHKEGVGAFRVKSMTRVKSNSHLRELLGV